MVMTEKLDLSVKGVRSSGSGKWWEFYFVRYFVGTVMGFGIILFLNFSDLSSLKGLLFPQVNSIKELSSIQSILIGSVGLAVCYIASAPILFLHAFRGDLLLHKNDEQTSDWKFTYFWRVVVSIITSSVICFFLYKCLYGVFFPTDKFPDANFYVLFAVITILWLQVYIIIQAIFNKFSVSANYYMTLAQLRSNREEGGSKYDEYIESYKHLREHGNAFFILFLELLFGATLALIETPVHGAILVMIWTLPGVFVWFWGNVLESKLSKI
jgi:hypothetical protein